MALHHELCWLCDIFNVFVEHVREQCDHPRTSNYTSRLTRTDELKTITVTTGSYHYTDDTALRETQAALNYSINFEPSWLGLRTHSPALD